MAKIYSEEELKNIFETLAKDRNHTIKEMNISTQQKSTLFLLCGWCNTEFKVSGVNYVRAGQKAKQSPQIEGKLLSPHCCPGCAGRLVNSGPATSNPSSHEKRDGYDSQKYAVWRQSVFTYYGGKCFLTGEGKREKLQSHHLNSWFIKPEDRYLSSNGVLVSASVHKEFHRQYGPHTTLLEFQQFCQINYGVSVFPWATSPGDMYNVQEVIKTQQALYQQEMETLSGERGYKIISGIYENKNSVFEVYCPKHDTKHLTKPFDFKRAVYGMPCCALQASSSQIPPSQKGLVRSPESLAKRQKTLQAKYYKKLEAKAESRNHEVRDGIFENTHSEFLIFCKKHQKSQGIAYNTYMKNVHGLRCCNIKRTAPPQKEPNTG